MTEPCTARVRGWIDVHAHFALPKSPDELEAGLRAMHAGCFLLPAPFQWQTNVRKRVIHGLQV